MPTNLPPEYYKVEKRFREAETSTEKIACLEEMISTVPHHKGTDHLRADLNKRLAKMRDAAKTQKGASRQESVFSVDREGAGRVILVGPPNVGKSALVAALTHATPQVSEAPFTTWAPAPGMMMVDDVQIQLIDTPPLNRDHVEAELFNLLRTADLILLVVDLQANPEEQLADSLAILAEHQIAPCGTEAEDDGLPRKIFLPLQVVVNKNDSEDFDEDFQIFSELSEKDWPMLALSATTGHNLESLPRTVYERLEIIRIYSKPPNKPPDMGNPFVLKRGETVEEFAGKVHQDFRKNLKTARIWGTDVYDGQQVGRDHVLHDGDVVEMHI
ncbi:MAG: TGS domain-containing protein [Gemmatimonadetes bacterium]|jgi:uncharacterized protein|nr:TGS domain-containing protein [Gemmatimonadota bacterium]